jgi:hypothetical protein
MKFHNRIIKVNGEETYFLRHWLSDHGIVIEVSGPQAFLYHENNITEYDGSQLDLQRE